MQRAQALCAAQPDPTKVSCTGNLFVGIFFDGTGNNEEEDFKKHPGDPRHHKHSNVVRLFHAYPEDVKISTNLYARYYIPGVGTPFPEIGDQGGMVGSATAWGGEPRIIWGLTRIFNAVYGYHYGPGFISDNQARSMTEGLGGVRSLGAQRRYVLKNTWQTKLKAAIEDRKPEILQINLSVFGFSRGAAQARAFVNWLYEICDSVDGGWRFAGIPLRVQFLGIFDTVASVGLAGLYRFLEGRQSWAADNMQVHPAVEQCLHLVAGHEVRACFPLDSVRIDGRYPPNAREYVYPGSHSDVGGGYMPLALGQADWDAGSQPSNLQLARVPGFEMYCAALAAGVPFQTIQVLEKNRQADVATALIPAASTLDAFRAYCQQASIQPGPVEDMARQHMRLYFNYRWQASESSHRRRPQFQRALNKPNAGSDYADEPKWLLQTQRALLLVIGDVCREIGRRMQANASASEAEGRPLANPYENYALKSALLDNDELALEGERMAREAVRRLREWREWLQRNRYPEIHRTEAPEREPLWILEALSPQGVPQAVARLFDELVHDSMAGFIGFGMPEFDFNGNGLAKFRRTYFGNRGDAVVRERVAAENEARRAAARQQRNEQLIRTTPPPVPPMSQWFPGR